MTELVPDGIEPIVAWRYWRFDEGRERLTSLNVGRGVPWEPGKVHEASCIGTFISMLRDAGHAEFGHDAPDSRCRCGIYAAADLKTLKQVAHPPPFPDLVVGECLLWGRVIRGERGERAQFAYPKSLHAVERDPPEALAAYGVPVGRMSVEDALSEVSQVAAALALAAAAGATAQAFESAMRSAFRTAAQGSQHLHVHLAQNSSHLQGLAADTGKLAEIGKLAGQAGKLVAKDWARKRKPLPWYRRMFDNPRKRGRSVFHHTVS